jgi:redox-sensing transcriptional repressor
VSDRPASGAPEARAASSERGSEARAASSERGSEAKTVVGSASGVGSGGDAGGDGGVSRRSRRIPEATVARLPVYLRSLLEVAGTNTVTISSERLAEMAGVNAAKVRKDLSYLGSYGTRGVGYDVEYLLFQISRELGLTQDWPVVIVGIGNLGHALANYKGFSARGFRVVALVDADAGKVGEQVGGIAVRHLDDLPAIAADEGVAIGIVATPASAAQDVADRLVAAGVTSILNFAPSVISVPKGVSLRKVDLSIELQILSFYQQRRLGLPSLPDPPEAGLPEADPAVAGPSEADPSKPAGVGLPS